MSIKSLLHFEKWYRENDRDYVVDSIDENKWLDVSPQYGAVGINASMAKFGTTFCMGHLQLVDTLSGNPFKLLKDGQYEFEFFLKGDSSFPEYADTHIKDTGEIRFIEILDGNSATGFRHFIIGINQYVKIFFHGNTGNTNYDHEYATTTFPCDDTWHHVLIRVADSKLEIYQDAVRVLLINNFAYDKDITSMPTICGGGDDGWDSFKMDEFVFRDNAGTGVPTIPTEPYPDPLNISGILPTSARADDDYSATLTASGGTSPYQWSVENLASGLNFYYPNQSSISFYGNADYSSVGNYSISVTLTDSESNTITKTYPLQITLPTAKISGTLTTGTVNSQYSSSLTATDGGVSSSYSWSYTGTLPPGVSFAADRSTYTLSGTPTTAGIYQFTVTCEDIFYETTTTKSCTVTIEAASEPDTPTATPGTAKTYTIQLKRGTVAAIMASNYIASPGEIVIATDTGEMRSGDGVNTWSNLPSYDGTEIANNLTTSASGKALDASQGRALNGRLETIENIMNIDCGEITE